MKMIRIKRFFGRAGKRMDGKRMDEVDVYSKFVSVGDKEVLAAAQSGPKNREESVHERILRGLMYLANNNEKFEYVGGANMGMFSYDSFEEKKGVICNIIHKYLEINGRTFGKNERAKIIKECFRYIFREDVFCIIQDERFDSVFLVTLKNKLRELMDHPLLECLREYEWFCNNEISSAEDDSSDEEMSSDEEAESSVDDDDDDEAESSVDDDDDDDEDDEDDDDSSEADEEDDSSDEEDEFGYVRYLHNMGIEECREWCENLGIDYVGIGVYGVGLKGLLRNRLKIGIFGVDSEIEESESDSEEEEEDSESDSEEDESDSDSEEEDESDSEDESECKDELCECPICMDSLSTFYLIEMECCKKMCCVKCLIKNRKKKCPYCRARYELKKLNWGIGICRLVVEESSGSD